MYETRKEILPAKSMSANTHQSVNASLVPCGSAMKFDYAIALSIICGVCSFFGICYLIVGYRYLKATFFLTGFVFGSLLLYLICIHQQFLPLAGNIGVAVSAGVVCGLVCMLLLLVGYFLTGFFTGFVLAVVILLIMHQITSFEHHWLTFGLLAGCSLLMALCNLKFQKGLTVLGTSVFGAALVIVGVDYFAEMFLLVLYLWSRIKIDPRQTGTKPTRPPNVNDLSMSARIRLLDAIPCWHTIVILAAFPVLVIIGLVIQVCVTAKGIEHQERIGLGRRRRRRRYRHVEGDGGFAEEPQDDHQIAMETRATTGENGKIYTSLVPSSSSGPQPGGTYDSGSLASRGGTSGTVQLRRGGRPDGARGSAVISTPDPNMKYCYLYHKRQIGGDVPSQSAMKDFRQTRQSALIAHYSDSSEAET